MRGSGSVRYVAQVQIIASTTENLTADSAARIVCDFAIESALSISRLFRSAEDYRRSDEGRSNANIMFKRTGSG